MGKVARLSSACSVFYMLPLVDCDNVSLVLQTHTLLRFFAAPALIFALKFLIAAYSRTRSPILVIPNCFKIA